MVLLGAGVALLFAVDLLPLWLQGVLVVAIGLCGLGLAFCKEWAREAKNEPATLLGYLLWPLPLLAWRLIIIILSLGVIALGIGGLLTATT